MNSIRRSSGEAAATCRYKAAIKDEFFPARGYGEGRLSIARKPVTEYKKVSKSPEGLIEPPR